MVWFLETHNNQQTHVKQKTEHEQSYEEPAVDHSSAIIIYPLSKSQQRVAGHEYCDFVNYFLQVVS